MGKESAYDALSSEQKTALEFATTPPIILEFLKAVIADSREPIQKVAHRQANQKQERKASTVGTNIMAAYLLTPASQTEVGRLYGVSSTRIKNITTHSLTHLYHAASDETRARFSLPEIVAAASKQPRLLSPGEAKVARELLKGVPIEELDFHPGGVSKLRKKLASIGIELPKKTLDHGLLAEQIQQATTDEAIEHIFENTEGAALRNLHQGRKGVLATVSEVAGELGYGTKNIPLVVEALQQAALPLAKVAAGAGYYYLIAAQHRERAREILRLTLLSR